MITIYELNSKMKYFRFTKERYKLTNSQIVINPSSIKDINPPLEKAIDHKLVKECHPEQEISISETDQ